MNARVLAVLNQKGGVGKTTTVVNLGHALAYSGYRVALLDMDPQGHLAYSLGFKNNGPGMGDLLLDEAEVDAIKVRARDKLDLIIAGKQLNRFEQLSEGGIARGHRLRLVIEQSSLAAYDFVLIDCPPSSGLLGVNAMFAAQELIIPVTADYLSLQGLSRMMKIRKRVEELAAHRIQIWLVSTRMQMRRKLSQEIRKRILKYFPAQVLKTPIRESVALAECPSFGKTILEYKLNSTGARDYLSLAADLVGRRTEDG